MLVRLILALLLSSSVAQVALALPAADDDSAAPARVVVKFRAGAKVFAQYPRAAGRAHVARAQALGGRLGLALDSPLSIADGTQVVTARGMRSADLAAKLAAQPDVEYAVVDQRRTRMALPPPNDQYYASGPANGHGAPAVGQWYLRAPDSTFVSAINAPGAWDVTTGSSSIVVAVLDTGVRPDHADLQGKLLPGYDFISDKDIAADGNGRDDDPTDPGDWISAAELNDPNGKFKGSQCASLPPVNGVYQQESSSWHGTQTASLIGAATNNGVGMASVGRDVKILPVRVLGKCGGYDSDITAAMRWAVGLDTGDLSIPVNPEANRARVLNLSLGGSGSCSQYYLDAIPAVLAKGAVIVVAAGNSEGKAVSSPANCPGVIAVGGLRHAGSKVGFSDLGPEIALSAPAGNCVNLSSPCLYPILTATNAGTTTPVSNSSIYTDSYDAAVGTSFAAPLVAGTAALMLSAQPGLTPDQVKSLLQSSARAFPTSGSASSPPVCTAPTSTAQDECYCTTSTCGAGMLDAAAAVRAAAGVIVQVTAPAPGGGTTTAPVSSGGGGGGGGATAPPGLLGLLLALGLLRRRP